MSNESLLIECFISALALPSGIDVTGMNYQNSYWDSVAHMRLVAAIETTFNIMLTTEQILDINNFQTAQTIVAQHGILFESQK